MLTMETTIRISLAEVMTLADLEQAVAERVQAAGRELLLRLGQAIAAQQLAEAGRELRRDKRRGLDLLMRFGWVRLERWQVQGRATGEYRSLPDQVLGLRPRQHASPWVLEQTVALATRVPYRQATHLLCRLLEVVDHRTIFAWVRQEGARIVAEEDAQQEAVFAQWQLAPCDQKVREVVVAGMDGAFLAAHREGPPTSRCGWGCASAARRWRARPPSPAAIDC